MGGVGIVLDWLLALAAGGALTIGLVTLITGRTRIWGRDFSTRDARLLGAIWTTCGLTYALYDLYGFLSLGAGLLPNVLGYGWGFLVTFVPAVILIAGLFWQALIVLRYERKRGPDS